MPSQSIMRADRPKRSPNGRNTFTTLPTALKKGTLSAMPRKGTHWVALGVAQGPYSCLQINADVWLHSRRVEWRRTEVPEVDLDGVNTKDRRWIYQPCGEGIAERLTSLMRRWIYQPCGEGIAERLTSLMKGSGRWPSS